MDLKKIKELLAKFYAGECSKAEEQELKDFFSKDKDLPESLAVDAMYFLYLAEEGNIVFSTDRIESRFLDKVEKKGTSVINLQNYRKLIMGIAIAASLALLVVFYYNFNLQQQEKLRSAHQVPDDPQKAYQEVKNALLTVSLNFNHGAEDVQKLSSFDKAKNNLKEEKENN